MATQGLTRAGRQPPGSGVCILPFTMPAWWRPVWVGTLSVKCCLHVIGPTLQPARAGLGLMLAKTVSPQLPVAENKYD